MKKSSIYFIILFCLLFIGCGSTNQNNENNDDQKSILIKNEPEVKQDIDAIYDFGYDTIDELMTVGTLIVKATPTSVESESNVGICWVLDVAESSIADIETIKLRQVKDEFMLTMDQEVVLVLQPDIGDGYYNIPGGGCGLFYMNQETNTADGLLISSLLENLPTTYSTDNNNSIDLDTVFNLLVEDNELTEE